MSYRIFLAGASGAIGSRLTPLLHSAGHYVCGSTRSKAKADALPDISWFTLDGQEMTSANWDSWHARTVTAFLNGEAITEPCDNAVRLDIPYPAGARLTVEIGGIEVAATTIIVNDLLVVGMGDSFGSGEGNPDIPVAQHPQYLQARAQVDEEQRQLDHIVVTAPFAGVVTNVPSITPGKYLQASMTAFYLVATEQVWIDANPKETELTYVRPGQAVTATVDTYPGQEWHGTVESISPAAAQEFSLLPAQNTSGNWVKVVQRIPMRVRLDTSDKSRPALRAGMSAVVDVDTGHQRGLPQFLTALFGRAQASP